MKTDTELQQDVMAELGWEPAVNAARIGVEVEDGVVTLSGHVDSYIEKWQAERAVQRVAGVRALAVDLAVLLPSACQREDTDIARTTVNMLQQLTQLQGITLAVTVEHGWVTLGGEVAWHYQRQAASRAVRHLMGVTGVSNNIAVRPDEALAVARTEIETALKRRTLADVQSIAVSIHGADVTLTGTVHSWSERELARHAAANTPGVRNVINKITVSI